MGAIIFIALIVGIIYLACQAHKGSSSEESANMTAARPTTKPQRPYGASGYHADAGQRQASHSNAQSSGRGSNKYNLPSAY